MAVALRRVMTQRFQPVAGREHRPEPREQARALIERAWRTRRAALRSPPAEEEGARVIAAKAEADLLKACADCRKAGWQSELSTALGKLGHLALDSGDGDRALALFEEAAAVAREADSPLRLAHAVRHLGQVHHKYGRLDEAERCYQEALDLYRGAETVSAVDHANALRPMAALREEHGDVDGARVLWRRASRLYRAAGIDEGVAECETRIARLQGLRGEASSVC